MCPFKYKNQNKKYKKEKVRKKKSRNKKRKRKIKNEGWFGHPLASGRITLKTMGTRTNLKKGNLMWFGLKSVKIYFNM